MQNYTFGLAVLLCPAPLLANSATAKHDVPLLAHPNPEAATIVSLKAPEPLTVLQRQGGWYQVTPAEKTTGWLRLFSVQFVKGRYQPDNIKLHELTGLVQSNYQQVTSSTGVRGLDKTDIVNAKPNFSHLQLLHGYQQSAAQAQAFANSAQLQPDLSVNLQDVKP